MSLNTKYNQAADRTRKAAHRLENQQLQSPPVVPVSGVLPALPGNCADAVPTIADTPEQLIYQLSYSHLELIVDLDDDLKCVFHEIECMRGNWWVRKNNVQRAGKRLWTR